MSAIVQSLDYGNGLDLANTYTQDYELDALTVNDGLTPVIDRDHSRSDNINLTGITDAVVAANSQTFGYTVTNRLQSADGPWGDLDYTYDGVGNRLTRVLDDGAITTQTFGYPALSNLIDDEDTGGVITRTFTHDAAGNMTKDVRGATTYDYVINHAGRISQVKINTVVKADYEYNARNQLVLRSTTVAGGPSGDVHLIYDRQGHLIAEADAATGTTFREYVWLADMPITVVADVDTASPILYYVHVDHLNRPVMMTDGLKANVWEAVWLPYGAAHAITGAAANDARFPGQWFQIEAGLHYNWHRHYDPTLARYTQPDPLGFVDGPSVFAYAKNSPQVFTDPDGRFIPILIGIAAGLALEAGADYLERNVCGCGDGSHPAQYAAAAAAGATVGDNLKPQFKPRVGVGGPGASQVTSRTRQLANKIFGNLRTVRSPTPTLANPLTKSRSVAAIVGRWAPIIGVAYGAYDIYRVGRCLLNAR